MLQKLQTGGTQRVVMQQQQLAVTQNGPAVVMNTPLEQDVAISCRVSSRAASFSSTVGLFAC